MNSERISPFWVNGYQPFSALTNKILTISKLENHKLEMNKTEVELTPIIEKLTEKFKAKAQKP